MLKKIKDFFMAHQGWCRPLFAIGLLCIYTDVFAEGTDILAGTADNLLKTIDTTGKTYMYVAEGIISIALYIKTKNLLVLAGIVVVSLFINIMLSMATAVAG